MRRKHAEDQKKEGACSPAEKSPEEEAITHRDGRESVDIGEEKKGHWSYKRGH